jgi:hypothetical protein
MQNVLIIQNTYFHFETTISLYFSLKQIGFSPKIITTHLEKDVYKQFDFINFYKMDLHNEETKDYLCAFVISSYPNLEKENEFLPNISPEILSKYKDRIIFICHRFKDIKNKIIKKENSLCLSPISQNLDFYFQFENPTPINRTKIENKYKVVIQGNIGLGCRTEHHIQRLQSTNKINLSVVGHECKKITYNEIIENISDINFCEDLYELDFYKKIESQHFVSAAISPNTKRKTYSTERFSSNFSLSLGLEKPLFCHEFFETIYKMPGIYYSRSNLDEQINKLINLSNEEYLMMCDKFSFLKKELRQHNDQILLEKIKNNS